MTNITILNNPEMSTCSHYLLIYWKYHTIKHAPTAAIKIKIAPARP